MDIVTTSKINQLLMNTDQNGLIFSAWLKAQGYSDQLQKKYRDSGWLTSLSQGVMYRTGSKLSAYYALATCNLQTNAKYRIAAHSALEFSGFNHYVPMGKPTLSVALYPTKKQPVWMKNKIFDMTFRTFHTEIFPTPEIIIKKEEHGILYISSPEQAFLECLLLAPKLYDYTDLYYIMEQLTTLRSDVVQRLLETVKNFSIKRLFLYMAEKAGHYWFEELNVDKINIGTSKIQLVPNGTYNSKYMITIPKTLNNNEEAISIGRGLPLP